MPSCEQMVDGRREVGGGWAEALAEGSASDRSHRVVAYAAGRDGPRGDRVRPRRRAGGLRAGLGRRAARARGRSAAAGGPTRPTTAMLGMSTPEWSRYLHGGSARAAEPGRARPGRRRRRWPTATRAQCRCCPAPSRRSTAWPGAGRSGRDSSTAELIGSCWRPRRADRFRVDRSSEEVAAGQAGPGRLPRRGAQPRRRPGHLRRGRGLGQRPAGGRGRRDGLVAVPNPHFPPPADALALAHEVREDLAALTPEAVLAAARR